MVVCEEGRDPLSFSHNPMKSLLQFTAFSVVVGDHAKKVSGDVKEYFTASRLFMLLSFVQM